MILSVVESDYEIVNTNEVPSGLLDNWSISYSTNIIVSFNNL